MRVGPSIGLVLDQCHLREDEQKILLYAQLPFDTKRMGLALICRLPRDQIAAQEREIRFYKALLLTNVVLAIAFPCAKGTFAASHIAPNRQT